LEKGKARKLQDEILDSLIVFLVLVVIVVVVLVVGLSF